MTTLRQLFKSKGTACSLGVGLLLAGLLGGCQTPFIDIKVQVDNTAGACPSGGTRIITPPDGGMGACSIDPRSPYTGPLIPQNYKVCKDFNNNIIACTGNEMCTGSNSRVCNDPPGNETRKICKSVWKQSAAGSMNGTCSCTSIF